MSLATFSARRVDLIGVLAVLITATALITTLVLLTVAPRAELGVSARESATYASVRSIASVDPRDGDYVGDTRDARVCDPSGNCRVP
jgi:hypothetical protein